MSAIMQPKTRTEAYPVSEETRRDGAIGARTIKTAVAEGAACQLVSASCALLTVRCVSLPLLDCFVGLFDAVLPAALRPAFDPHVDRQAVLMLTSALGGFLVAAVGVCGLLDLLPTHRLKTQSHRSYFTGREWLQAFAVAMLNLLCFSWFAVIPAWCLQRGGLLRGGTPVATLEDEWRLPAAALHHLAHGVVIDVWFYTTHRALHWPPLYRTVHRIHHRFRAPVAVACVYAHPAEFVVGNVLGVVLGPALTNAHPLTCAFWMANSLITTAFSHSGYLALGATDHDRHHLYYDTNFGVGLFMDRLLGTGFVEDARAAGAKRRVS